MSLSQAPSAAVYPRTSRAPGAFTHQLEHVAAIAPNLSRRCCGLTTTRTNPLEHLYTPQRIVFAVYARVHGIQGEEMRKKVFLPMGKANS